MMSVDPARLLRRLEPAVRPVGDDVLRPAAPRAAGEPFERLDFGSMLALVSTGEISSGRAVENRSGSEELDAAQLARLAAAADMAEAHGAARALMLIDGRALVMDVAARRLEREIARADTHRVLDVEIAVHVASAPDDGPARLAPPGGGVVPPFITRQLEGGAPAATARRDDAA